MNIVLRILYLIVEKYATIHGEKFDAFYNFIKNKNTTDEFCNLYKEFDNYVSSSFLIFYNEHHDYYLRQFLHNDAIKKIDTLVIDKQLSDPKAIPNYNEILDALRFNKYYIQEQIDHPFE